MNKRMIRILCFLVLLCMVGCGSLSADSPNEDAPDEDSLMTVTATVTKIYGKSMEIRVEQGQVMSMPTSWLEGKVEPKEGLLLEITASNEILETYPSQFSKIESVEVIGYDEPEDTAWQGGKAFEKVVIAPPEGAYCNISLCLPEDWDWSCSQSEDIPVSCIGLAIYPKAEGDANGCISIQYAQGFGVCGTGLESVETMFNGHAAYKGTYDGHPYWDFISLSGDYSGCAIINSAGETWFDKYQKELEAIFATVEFTLSDGTAPRDFSEGDIGEIYAKDPTGNDVVVSADGTKYVRNQLLVSAKMDCTKEKMDNLGSAYGFEIVGYIELTQDYQIEFTRDMEEAELLKMIKVLEEEDCISTCSLNYVTEVSYD